MAGLGVMLVCIATLGLVALLMFGCGDGGAPGLDVVADGATGGDSGVMCPPPDLEWCHSLFDCEEIAGPGDTCYLCQCRIPGSLTSWSGCFKATDRQPAGVPCGRWRWTSNGTSCFFDREVACDAP